MKFKIIKIIVKRGNELILPTYKVPSVLLQGDAFTNSGIVKGSF